MSMIQLPEQVTFREWLLDLNRSLIDLIVPNPPVEITDWRKWAMQLIFLNKARLGRICLPLKSQFPKDEDWKRWAYFFIQNTTL